MTRLNALADRISGQAFGLTNYGNIEADVNYLVVPGGNLAALGGGNTLTIAARFHEVTLGSGNNIDNITDALGAVGGQEVVLLFDQPQTIRNNGAGAGNIRTSNGVDKRVSAGELVLLRYDSTATVWRIPNGVATKDTEKAVTTIAETDLLNAEFTLAANALGLAKLLRLTAWGDGVQNSAGTTAFPKFKFKLGATVLIDTGTCAAQFASSATRFPWRITVEVKNLAATNVQLVYFELSLGKQGAAVSSFGAFTTGEGSYSSTTSGAPTLATGYNAGAVDTTAAQAVVLSVITPSGVSTDVTLKGAVMEVVG
jgi:hypothetical protein